MLAKAWMETSFEEDIVDYHNMKHIIVHDFAAFLLNEASTVIFVIQNKLVMFFNYFLDILLP